MWVSQWLFKLLPTRSPSREPRMPKSTPSRAPAGPQAVMPATGSQPGGQENVVSRGRGEAGLGEDQRDGRKAEAHDREDAERGGKLILVQECGDEAHHNADAAAQYHVIDEALPGGEPLALSGAGVLAGQAVLPKARRVTTAQNEDGDARAGRWWRGRRCR